MNIDRPIAIAIILFIILLLIFFLVVPEYKVFKNLQVELGEKRAEFNAQFDYYAAITRTYFDLQVRQDDIKKIDNALPSTFDLGEIIYFLQKTAKENGLLLKELFLSKSSPAPASAGINNNNNVRDMVFSINLLGSYSALENFILSLEKSSRIFEVTNISFGSGAGASSQQQSFSLQIRTYSY